MTEPMQIFLAKWQASGGAERANYQHFLVELCGVLGVPRPDPSVPEAARVPVVRYVNPRKAQWPEADFIVGNPPYIGNKRMRQALGDGYVEALRAAHPEVPETVDLVMYVARGGRASARGAGQASASSRPTA